MSTINSYPVRSFAENQKFFVYDPASQTSSLVTGADIKQSIQAGESSVVATSTFQALKTESYAIGTIVQTSGGNAIGDTSNGLYVIQPPGSGGTPIFNGNEAVELPLVNFAVSDVSNATVVNDSGTRTIEVLADDVDLKVFRATNAADVAALPAVPGYQVSVSGVAAGTFKFSGINFSSAVGSDPLQITYIAPSTDPTGASGAWVRQPEFYNNSSSTLSSESSQSAIDELDEKEVLLRSDVDPLLTQSISGSATFENSTNSITLSGIGNLGTLEVGDVIQISGSTSNDKEFTVEVITDTNNLIVNAAHAGGTTIKSLVDETVSATVTLVAKWFNASVGLGQGFCEPASGRLFGTTYTNLTERTIQLWLGLGEASGSGNYTLTIDGFLANYTIGSGLNYGLEINIPPNSEYKCTKPGGSSQKWMELR
jgi:hypothetical protein